MGFDQHDDVRRPVLELPNRGSLFVREGRLRPRHGEVRGLVTVSRRVRCPVDVGHLLQNFAIGLAVPRLFLMVLRVKIVHAQQRKQRQRQLYGVLPSGPVCTAGGK